MPLASRPVDPRDVSIEESEPTYRVYFWDERGGYCREYKVTGADTVEEVIDWCDENVETGEIYILGVLWPLDDPPHSRPRSVAFIRLKGDPPPGQSIGTRVG